MGATAVPFFLPCNFSLSPVRLYERLDPWWNKRSASNQSLWPWLRIRWIRNTTNSEYTSIITWNYTKLICLCVCPSHPVSPDQEPLPPSSMIIKIRMHDLLFIKTISIEINFEKSRKKDCQNWTKLMFGIKLKIGTKSTKLENFREIEKKSLRYFFSVFR